MKLTFQLILLFSLSSFYSLGKTTENQTSDFSTICFYRPYKFAGSACNLSLQLNNSLIGDLSAGLKLDYKIYSEGKVSIIVKPYCSGVPQGNPQQIILEVENGKSYYIEANIMSKTYLTIKDSLSAEAKLKISYNIKSKIALEEDKNNPIAINSKKKFSAKSGSGFLISTNGYIVTNYHVIEGGNKITVTGINGNFANQYLATIVSQDKNNDLAIIKIDGVKFDSIPFVINLRPAKTGEDIFVLGYPLTSELGKEVKLTNGLISSTTGYQNDISTYQISAPVQPGNSGGPLFNKDGNLIGIVNAKYLGADNVSYSIKVNYLKTLIDLTSADINVSTQNLLGGKSLPEQITLLKNFIFIIEVNKE